MSASLIEIFASIQGEGIYVGVPTVFVRFGGCDLRCAWCDSPGTWSQSPRCRVEEAPGSERFGEIENPLATGAVLEIVAGLDPERRMAVSLTGGEPLLQAASVGELARHLGEDQREVHLETHGLAAEALGSVVEAVDVVAMDWKLASDVRRAEPLPGESDFHAAHEDFLRCAWESSARVFVKVVVSVRTDDEELGELCRRVASVSPEIPLVVQPVTPCGSVRESPPAGSLIRWAGRCREQLSDVRVIPQTHRSYGAL